MPSSPLDYAPLPTSTRRWVHRILRRWPLLLLLATVAFSIAYAPRAWRHYNLLRLQQACMTAELPRNRVVQEADPVAANALLTAWPAEYQTRDDGVTVRVDPRWAALSTASSIPPYPGLLLPLPLPPQPLPTTYCHERHTPKGQRRLVILEGYRLLTVIEPAGPFSALRIIYRQSAPLEETSSDALEAAALLYTGATRVDAAISTPSDPSRFTVSFILQGIHGTFEYQLQDDDQVTIRLLNHQNFIKQINDAKTAFEAARRLWPQVPHNPPHPDPILPKPALSN